MKNQDSLKFLWLILILVTLINSNLVTTAETYKISSNCFKSKNGTLDTGYRSMIFSNDTGTVGRTVTIRYSNVTQNSILLGSLEYNATWYYIQTNLFISNFILENNSNKIEINVNPDGYLNNITTIVWRLLVETFQNGPLIVCVTSSQIINVLTPIATLTKATINNDTNNSKAQYDLIPLVLTLTFTVLFILRKIRKH